MKRQLGWILRGADRTQSAFDDQAETVRGLQRQLAELHSVVGRIDADAARIDAAATGQDRRMSELTERLDQLTAKIDQIDDTVNDLVRVTAPPTDD